MGPVSPRFQGGTLEPVSTGEDFAAWFTGLLSQYPAAYATINAHLKQVMPDTKDFFNMAAGGDSLMIVTKIKPISGIMGCCSTTDRKCSG